MTAQIPTPQQVEHWLKRQQAQKELNQSLAREARVLLDRIVTLLVQKYGVRRIILFGSLARGRFDAESDIDLAVEGLAKEDYFTALAAASDLADRWVDLKPLEELEDHFKQRVLATGECIYAQDEQQRDAGTGNRYRD
jgi:uncharacterized protein